MAGPAATAVPSAGASIHRLLEPRVLLKDKFLSLIRASLILQLLSCDFCIQSRALKFAALLGGFRQKPFNIGLQSQCTPRYLCASLPRRHLKELTSLCGQSMGKDKPHIAVTSSEPPLWPPAQCSVAATGQAPHHSSPFLYSLQDCGQWTEAHPGCGATLCQHL